MLVRVLSIDPEEGGLLVVQAGDQTLRAMNCVGYGMHEAVIPGSEIEVELSCLHGDEEEWEEIFTGNPHKEQRLMAVGDWSYRAFGQVVSVGTEVLVNCGVCQLSAPVQTNDPNCVGAYVAFTVARLNAWLTSAA